MPCRAVAHTRFKFVFHTHYSAETNSNVCVHKTILTLSRQNLQINLSPFVLSQFYTWVRFKNLLDASDEPMGNNGCHSGRRLACRDRPRVCPSPTPIRFTDRITYFPLSFGCGQTRGLSLHAGLLPEWETLLNRIHIILWFHERDSGRAPSLLPKKAYSSFRHPIIHKTHGL